MGLFSFKSKTADEAAPETAAKQPGFLTRLRAKLNRGDSWLTYDLANLLPGGKIDETVLEELEMRLVSADVGIETTEKILEGLRGKVARKELANLEALIGALRQSLLGIIGPVSRPLEIDAAKRPFVILVVGVNGSGKTTTIGKIARLLKNQGCSVMLAAGDTFRAAAVEQLKAWGERNQVPVVAQQQGSDAASVIFDALQAARSRNIDVLIADTVGRLHTQTNLMEELKKIKRVINKKIEGAPHEIMLILDATTGQNSISQARLFNEAVGLTGLALTKLDGTAKGGIVVNISHDFNIPIRFIGIGEKLEDLRDFDPREFIEALFVNGSMQ